jgi:hypothetical protein
LGVENVALAEEVNTPPVTPSVTLEAKVVVEEEEENRVALPVPFTTQADVEAGVV